MPDYIIIGAGTAGSILAHRLTEDPHTTVLLLEAGGQPDHPLIRIPANWFDLMGTDVDWGYFSEPQPHADNRRLVWNRGKALGGSSSINAMLYVRGHRWDFDQWAALGNPGWSYTEVLPYFKKCEHQESGESFYHGIDGGLNVADHPLIHPVGDVFIAAGQQMGLPFNPDFNGETQYGVGWYQANQKNGERHSAFEGYLKPALQRDSLTALTHAQVTRILFDGVKAVGVEYVHEHHIKQAFAECEIILSAGAIHSPQILLCSGVGAAQQLQQFEIPVILDLPGVGENLQDHPKVDLHFTSKTATHRDFSLAGDAYADYLTEERGGILSVIRSQAGAFIKTRHERDIPDMQLYAAVASTQDPFDFAIVASLLRPEATGRVTIRSASIWVPPAIQPNFLAHADDRRTFLDAVRWIRDLMRTPAFAAFASTEVHPGSDHQTDDALSAWVRSALESTWHCSSTCKMGMDTLSVVDPQLRVHGVQGLRVVDASVMPTTVGGNTHAAVAMIAEKAADIIRRG